MAGYPYHGQPPQAWNTPPQRMPGDPGPHHGHHDPYAAGRPFAGGQGPPPQRRPNRGPGNHQVVRPPQHRAIINGVTYVQRSPGDEETVELPVRGYPPPHTPPQHPAYATHMPPLQHHQQPHQHHHQQQPPPHQQFHQGRGQQGFGPMPVGESHFTNPHAPPAYSAAYPPAGVPHVNLSLGHRFTGGPSSKRVETPKPAANTTPSSSGQPTAAASFPPAHFSESDVECGDVHRRRSGNSSARGPGSTAHSTHDTSGDGRDALMAMAPKRIGKLDKDESPDVKRQVLRLLHDKAEKMRIKDGPQVGEEDPHRIQQRQKQILFGKVTTGYRRYALRVPKYLRQQNNAYHPQTPRADLRCSKRRWDLLMQIWRRELHLWDRPLDEEEWRKMVPSVEAIGAAELVFRDDPSAAVGEQEVMRHQDLVRTCLDGLSRSVEASFGKNADGADDPPAAAAGGSQDAAAPLAALARLDSAQNMIATREPCVANPRVDIEQFTQVRLDAAAVRGPFQPQPHASEGAGYEPATEQPEGPQNASMSSSVGGGLGSAGGSFGPGTPGEGAGSNGTVPYASPVRPAQEQQLHEQRFRRDSFEGQMGAEDSGPPSLQITPQGMRSRRPPFAVAPLMAGAVLPEPAVGGGADPNMLPSPAKAALGPPLAAKPISIVVSGQAVNASGVVGGPSSYRLDCPHGGSPAEVYRLLAASFEVAKLSFHVAQATRTFPSSPSDAGPPETETTASPATGVTPSHVTSDGSQPSTPEHRGGRSVEPASPTSPTTLRATPASVRPFAFVHESRLPSAPTAIRAGGAAANTQKQPNPQPQQPQRAEHGCSIHKEQCAVYRLDVPANVALFLSFYHAGLPLLYFDVTSGPVLKAAPPAGNPNDFSWRSVTPLNTDGTEASPPSDMTFRATVSPDAINGILDTSVTGMPGNVASGDRFFQSPTPGSRAGQPLRDRLELQTPVEVMVYNSVGRPQSRASPMRAQVPSTPFHNSDGGSRDREESFQRDESVQRHLANAPSAASVDDAFDGH